MATPSTEVIFPAVFAANIAEFRLNMAPGYRNLRLANLGVTTAGSPAMFTDAAGVYGIISRVALYDGGTLLDEIVDAFAWLAFQNLRRAGPGRDSGLDHSLFTPLTASSRSYALSPDGQTLTRVTTRNGAVATTEAATTAKGWLSVASVLNFVARSSFIDTRAMPGARLVLELRTTPDLIFAGDTAAVAAVTPLAPVLLAERVTAAEMDAMPLRAVAYTRVLTERVAISGSAAAIVAPAVTPQTAALRLLAPTGRVVNRILCAGVRSDAAAAGEVAVDDLKDGSAEIFDGERWQFSVNGENLLPYSGCDSWARKQHLLWQAWGDVHVPQGGAYQGWTNVNPSVNSLAGLYDVSRVLDAAPPAAGALSSGPLVGKQSYAGFIVGRRVADLQLRYDRNLTQRRPGGATLRFFYECPAAVSGLDPARPASYVVAFA